MSKKIGKSRKMGEKLDCLFDEISEIDFWINYCICVWILLMGGCMMSMKVCRVKLMKTKMKMMKMKMKMMKIVKINRLKRTKSETEKGAVKQVPQVEMIVHYETSATKKRSI